MRKTGWLVSGMVMLSVGIAVPALGAGPATPKQAGQLRVMDANGKKVGRAISTESVGRGTIVAFKFGHQSFLLTVKRNKVEADYTVVYFTSPDCSGPAFLQDQGGLNAALARMTLMVGLSSSEGTLWVVDPHTTPTQTIQPKSYGLEGGDVRAWHCHTDISGSVEVFPATRLFDFYHEFTPPFAIR